MFWLRMIFLNLVYPHVLSFAMVITIIIVSVYNYKCYTKLASACTLARLQHTAFLLSCMVCLEAMSFIGDAVRYFLGSRFTLYFLGTFYTIILADLAALYFSTTTTLAMMVTIWVSYLFWTNRRFWTFTILLCTLFAYALVILVPILVFCAYFWWFLLAIVAASYCVHTRICTAVCTALAVAIP